MIEVKTQAALDKAVKAGAEREIRLIGTAYFVVRLAAAVVSPVFVVMPGAHLDVASESSARKAVVTARENSQVTARGNSQVTARGYAFVRTWSTKPIKASKTCIIAIQSDAASAVGGKQIACPPAATPKAWCEFYGVEVTKGVAIVYKAVLPNYHSRHGANYAPGLTPIAADWDGGVAECGGGLHFSPDPAMAREFCPEAVNFLACPVALKDIAIHPNGQSPHKIKARGCCGPTVEVDINRRVIEPPKEST